MQMERWDGAVLNISSKCLQLLGNPRKNAAILLKRSQHVDDEDEKNGVIIQIKKYYGLHSCYGTIFDLDFDIGSHK